MDRLTKRQGETVMLHGRTNETLKTSHGNWWADESWCKEEKEALSRLAEYEDKIEAGLMIPLETIEKVLPGWLNGEFYCTRVWEAWNYGTMTQEDFKPIDVDEIIQSIKEAAIEAQTTNK
jgi:hypothetical protein